MIAVSLKEPDELVDFLLRKGADVNIKSKNLFPNYRFRPPSSIFLTPVADFSGPSFCLFQKERGSCSSPAGC